MKNKKSTDTTKTPPVSQNGKKRQNWRRLFAEKFSGMFSDSFKLTKKYPDTKEKPKITGSVKLLRQAIVLYKANWKLFLGLSLIYIVTLWVITGLPNQQAYNNLKDFVTESLDGQVRNVIGISTLLLGAFGGIAGSEQTELQQFLTALTGVIFWLIFVWVVRQLQAGNSITIRQALYNASTPLIPLLTLIFVLALQLIPGALGALLISYAFGTEVFGIDGVESMLFTIAGLLLILLSVYWALQTLFAMIIVTLPNTYPVSAISSAKTVVLGRRGTILLRLGTMVLTLVIVWFLVMVPVIYLDTLISPSFVSLVPIVLDVLSALTLPILVIYLYRLYRELL